MKAALRVGISTVVRAEPPGNGSRRQQTGWDLDGGGEARAFLDRVMDSGAVFKVRDIAAATRQTSRRTGDHRRL